MYFYAVLSRAISGGNTEDDQRRCGLDDEDSDETPGKIRRWCHDFATERCD
jgi:hypothetical protein